MDAVNVQTAGSGEGRSDWAPGGVVSVQPKAESPLMTVHRLRWPSAPGTEYPERRACANRANEQKKTKTSWSAGLFQSNPPKFDGGEGCLREGLGVDAEAGRKRLRLQSKVRIGRVAESKKHGEANNKAGKQGFRHACTSGFKHCSSCSSRC